MTWTILAPVISAAVATVAFVFQASYSVYSRKREAERRDWERLQALAQVLFNGAKYGLWAQKLAVQELAQLKTKREQVLLLCKETLDFWKMNPGHQDLSIELQRLFDRLRR